MSAEPADAINTLDYDNQELAITEAADPLAEKIDVLIALCHTLDQHRREYRETAERLADDNANLRRVLRHTHQQIEQLADHIRQMEE